MTAADRIAGTRIAVTVALFIAPALAAPPHPAQEPAPGLGRAAVTIDSGALAGAESEGVQSFKGVPFAAPPVGMLRWRAPQPVVPWMGVRPATEYGHDCMQIPVPSDAAPAGTTPSEDCLVLNVWRPAVRKPGEKLPVMVWIPGGAYVNGGTSPAVYDGSALARQGIVFVSANYRLGRFGFFAHPALISAQEGPVGNFAYMDQIEALRWVKRNAAAFGGDPDRVTLAGESAGGDSVMHLLTSPAAAGLFHRAVVMSGGGRFPLQGGVPLTGGDAQAPSAAQIGVAFAASVGITGSGPEALAALRAVPEEKVLGGINMLSLLNAPEDPLTHTEGAIVDGNLVLASPGEGLRARRAAPMPILIGTTSADLPAKLPPLVSPLSYFGSEAGRALKTYNPNGTLQNLPLIMTIGVDMAMHEPARFVARQMTASGAPAWLYRFDYVAGSLGASATGAAHATDVPYFLGTIAARYGDAVTGKDRSAARLASGYLANFVKTGDPNGQGLPAWKKVDPSRSDLMMLTREGGAAMKADPLKARLDLVERAASAAASAAAAISDPAAARGPLTGTATFRERIALPPEAVLEVLLEDVSKADAPAERIGRALIEGPGNPPIPFEIPYDPSRIVPGHRYAVRARLTVGDKTWFATDRGTPVLAGGSGNDVAILLKRAGGAPGKAAGSEAKQP
jgi:para-nitrobenzyl esterase